MSSETLKVNKRGVRKKKKVRLRRDFQHGSSSSVEIRRGESRRGSVHKNVKGEGKIQNP